MSAQPPTIHVVFGLSAAGSIRQALRQVGCGERVIGFPDDLSFGPIDRATARSREEWIADKLGCRYGRVCREADEFWTGATSRDASPVVWLCRNHALEFSAFLEFVWRAEAPFLVIDASDVVLPRSPLRKAGLWSLGILTPNQIVEASLLASQTGLSPAALADYRSLWRRLRSENAPFRVVDETGLRSAPITYFDEAIMTRVSPDWQTGARVVGTAMVELIERPFSQCPGDAVIWSRLLSLVEMGRIEIDGPGPSMREHSVRLAR